MQQAPVNLPPDATQFEALMARHAAEMPAPGLSYFEKRRALWYTPPANPPSPPSPSPSRIKLEALLGQPGAVESDEVWRAGLKNVWKGLVGGNMLRKRLPLDIVVRLDCKWHSFARIFTTNFQFIAQDSSSRLVARWYMARGRRAACLGRPTTHAHAPTSTRASS